MNKITVSQKAIKKLFEFAKPNKLYVSNGYVTNSYVLLTHDVLKNHTDLIKTNDGENFFFDAPSLIKIGKLPIKDSIQRMTDLQIEQAITPEGENIATRTYEIVRTNLVIDIGTARLQVWCQWETNEIILFNDEVMQYYKIEDTKLFGWHKHRIFFDTKEGDFMVGVMPSTADAFFSGDKKQELLANLQALIQVVEKCN